MQKLFISLLVFACFTSFAQDTRPVQAGQGWRVAIEGKFVGSGVPTSDDIELLPQLSYEPSKNESDNKKALRIIKEELMKEKLATLDELNNLLNDDQEVAERKIRSTTPTLVAGYNALGNQGTPSDNTIAINKNNQIICCVNSSLRMYNATNGVAISATTGLSGFFSTPSNGTLLTNNTCDPKVIFDPQAERFIVFAQTCQGNSSTSQLLLAFSKSADPTAGWNFYVFTGNPSASLGQNVWFDYPKIGVSNKDVFVTGNMFNNNMNYVQSVIYQINKEKCYAGQSLAQGDAVLWFNLDNSPFTMVPVSNGQGGGYGNNMFLLSTNNSAFGSFINVYEINNAVTANPQISVQLVATDTTGSPADAIQNGSNTKLSTGDNRGMDGFYLNGTIHYVFHANVGGGYSGINYSRLRKVGNNWSLQRRIIRATGKDYSYPSIQSAGWNTNDQSAFIGYLMASPSDFPSIQAVHVDNDMKVSAPLMVRAGTGYASVAPQSGVTRWGDYSGMSRILNESVPGVWMFGMFGNVNHTWTNHFAKISTVNWPASIEENTTTNNINNLYPNPVREEVFSLKLHVPENGNLQVVLTDLQGKTIRNVMNTPVEKGPNLFTFNKGALANGTYLLRVSLNNKPIYNEKIIVTD